MLFNPKGIIYWAALPFLMSNHLVHADTPCDGPNALLAIVDSPTAAASACVVPNKNIVLELGYTTQSLTQGGKQYNVPQGELRLGLPYLTEFTILLPTYMANLSTSEDGFSSTALGIKHQIKASTNWVISTEALFTPPSGSAAYGSRGWGETLNGIVSYNLTDAVNLSVMLGIASQTQSILDGGKRYVSVNPDVVLSWGKDKIQLYNEVYGQSKTAPDENSGFNMDTGVIYLLQKNIIIDFSFGQRLSGSLGGYNHYIEAGMVFQFN